MLGFGFFVQAKLLLHVSVSKGFHLGGKTELMLSEDAAVQAQRLAGHALGGHGKSGDNEQNCVSE